ncbi:unnamed protein product, partial [Strongylus vulgaris]
MGQTYKSLVDRAHALDKTRPVTIVYGGPKSFVGNIPKDIDNDKTPKLVDVIYVNRYYGWYIGMGHMDWVNQSVYWDVAQWSEKWN